MGNSNRVSLFRLTDNLIILNSLTKNMSFVNQPGNMSTAPKTDPKVIKYSGGVVHRTGESGGFFKNVSEVLDKQKLFQSNNQFVHMKTPGDRRIYTYAMYGSLVGMTVA